MVCLQPDAIIDDTSFAFPFDSYRDKDFVALGNATALRNGQFQGTRESSEVLSVYAACAEVQALAHE